MSRIDAIITLVNKNEIRALGDDGQLHGHRGKTVVGITHGENLRPSDRVVLRVSDAPIGRTGDILSAVKIGNIDDLDDLQAVLDEQRIDAKRRAHDDGDPAPPAPTPGMPLSTLRTPMKSSTSTTTRTPPPKTTLFTRRKGVIRPVLLAKARNRSTKWSTDPPGRLPSRPESFFRPFFAPASSPGSCSPSQGGFGGFRLATFGAEARGRSCRFFLGAVSNPQAGGGDTIEGREVRVPGGAVDDKFLGGVGAQPFDR